LDGAHRFESNIGLEVGTSRPPQAPRRRSSRALRTIWQDARASVGSRLRSVDEAAEEFVLRAVGRVRSPLRTRAQAPLQGVEGAPESCLEFEPEFAPAITDLQPGQELLVLTWLHL